MTNRNIMVYKFESQFLKEHNYKLNLSFDEAESCGQIIKIADNQFLRTIRRFTLHTINFQRVERLYHERDILSKKNCDEERRRTVTSRINRSLFVPEYMEVFMATNSQYKEIIKKRITLNGKVYRRLSCSAGQARNETVIFCSEDIISDVKKAIDNDRKPIPVAPSKYNAYFGLAGSATQIVSEPRFIVVKDFENETSFKCHWVEETGDNEDDIISEKVITQKMNRTDGMGLISPRLAKKWAEELDLDYVPSQFGIRQAFLKGMLCVFDIHSFCKEKNHGNYIIETVYGEKVDIRDYDIIFSESQFKLWNAYDNEKDYADKCRKNKLYWGVPQYAPEECKNTLKMNYQFLQTLNIKDEDIPLICNQTVEWIRGVSYANPAYIFLFFLGANITEQKIKTFLQYQGNWWLKALIANPDLMVQDKYIQSQIKRLIKKKIHDTYIGEIFLEGNFQILVSDPYAFMQSVCGITPTGLLKENEYYSNYWNERGVSLVDGMRSPLTFRSEHVLMNLLKNDETEKWYKHCKTGVILNWHGHDCVNFAGSDFDLDILATTCNDVVLRSTYKNELPVGYDVSKPVKILPTEEDLIKADFFSFGSIIGSITNKSSNAYALLANLERNPEKNKEQIQIVYSRLIQCCKAQGKQIDKAKIGQKVKGIPNIWIKYIPHDDRDTDEITQQKDLINTCLLDKPPYFFIYRYPDYYTEYRKYIKNADGYCKKKYHASLNTVSQNPDTADKKKFINSFYKKMPVVDSPSSMNKICHYLENTVMDIQSETTINPNISKYLRDNTVFVPKEKENEIISAFTVFLSEISTTLGNKCSDLDIVKVFREIYRNYRISDIVNVLVDNFYNSKASVLWIVIGKNLLHNLCVNTVGEENVMIPFPDEQGEIEYMNKRYSWRAVK